MPRATVSRMQWQNHIIRKLRKGYMLTLWQDRARLWHPEFGSVPCPLKSARPMLLSGMLEPTGQGTDGQFTHYQLRPEFAQEAPILPVLVDDAIDEEEMVTDEDTVDAEDLVVVLAAQADVSDADAAVA